MSMNLKNIMEEKGHYFIWKPGGSPLEMKYSHIKRDDLTKFLPGNNILKAQLLNEGFLLPRALLYNNL